MNGVILIKTNTPAESLANKGLQEILTICDSPIPIFVNRAYREGRRLNGEPSFLSLLLSWINLQRYN